jgi:hypothetical protein
MYDIYRHADTAKSDFRLTVLQGAGLPEKAFKSNWRLVANRKKVPKIIADEIARAGFSITRPKRPAV